MPIWTSHVLDLNGNLRRFILLYNFSFCEQFLSQNNIKWELALVLEAALNKESAALQEDGWEVAAPWGPQERHDPSRAGLQTFKRPVSTRKL